MDYQILEDDMVTRLSLLIGPDVIVTALPQNEEEFTRPVDYPKLTVGYDSSDYAEECTTGAVMAQAETIKMIVTIQAFSLRGHVGDNGVYALKKKIKDAVMGWIPPHCDMPIKLKYFGPPNLDPAFIDNMWYYELHLITRTMEVQEIVPEEPIIVSNFTAVESEVEVQSTPIISMGN